MVFLPKYQNLKGGKHEQTQITALKCFEIGECTEELFQTEEMLKSVERIPCSQMCLDTECTILCFALKYISGTLYNFGWDL